jgi:flavin-binding protein dodecin
LATATKATLRTGPESPLEKAAGDRGFSYTPIGKSAIVIRHFHALRRVPPGDTLGHRQNPHPIQDMSTAKVIEIISEGASIEDALKNTVRKADQSADPFNRIWVEHITALVEEGKIARYRVDAKLTFALD